MVFDLKQIDGRRVTAERRQAVKSIEIWLMRDGLELLTHGASSTIFLRLFGQSVLYIKC